MVTSSQLARDIAASVLTHPSFLESCIMLRSTEGHRDLQHGEWVQGATQETPIRCPTVPITGSRTAYSSGRLAQRGYPQVLCAR